MQGPSHHQGSLSLNEYAAKYSDAHGGQPINTFEAFALSHKGKASAPIHYNPEDPPEAYSNPTAYSRLSSYSEVAKEVYGQDYDPRSHDLDGEVVMRAGKGKKHGRYYLGDSVIDTASTPTLSQIRARTVSGGPSIRERPTATQALQAQLEEERARREQLEATLEQRVQAQAQAQAQMQAQVQDMFSYFQAQFEAIGHPLPPHPTWAPRPPISSLPMPGSAGSNAGAGAAPVQDVDLSAAVRNIFPSALPPFDQ
ncbi:hypothetical protein EJB05_52779 [Eragrostis curvula]|uniref:Uncharacterized protein n=1 Tax=Eragrostis curvula TaxID=38414 RepID=A0A5J9SRZ9_9POAL|nr:hypothetical protein EJB05_52779 [Eragrostis curvula]